MGEKETMDNHPPAPRPKKRWKKILAWVGGIVAGLVVLVILIGPPVAAGIAKSKIKAAVEEKFNGTAEIGSLSLSLGGYVEAADVRILTRDGLVMIELPKLTADLKVLKAIGGSYELVAFLERPKIHLKRGTLEAFMKQAPAQPPPAASSSSPSEEPKPLNLKVDLKIAGGTITVEDAPRRTEIRDLELTLNLPALDQPSPFNARLTIGGRPVTLTGTTTVASKRVELAYTIDTLSLKDLEAAAAVFAGTHRLEGTLTAQGKHEIVFPKIQGTDRWTIENLRAADAYVPSATVEHTISTDDTGRGASTLKLVSARAVEISAQTKLTDLGKDTAAYDATISVTSDLGELSRALRSLMKLQSDKSLEGTLKADARVRMAGKDFSVQGSLLASNLAAVQSDGKKIVIDPEVKVDLDAGMTGNDVRLSKLHVQSIPVQVNATGGVRDLDVQVHANLKQLGEKLKSFLESDLALDGSVDLGAQKAGDALTCRGDIRSLVVGTFGPLDLSLDASLDLAGDLVTVRSGKVRSNAFDIDAGGAYGKELSVTAVVKPDGLARVLRRPPMRGSGIVLDLTLKGPAANLDAAARLTIHELTTETRMIRGVEFQAKLLMKDSRPTQAALKGPGIDVGFHDETVSLRLDPAGISRDLDLKELAGKPITGSLRIDDGIRGTLELPELVAFDIAQRGGKLDLDIASSGEIRKASFTSQTGSITARGRLNEKVVVQASCELASAIRDLAPKTNLKYGGAFSTELTITRTSVVQNASIRNLALDGRPIDPEVKLRTEADVDVTNKNFALKTAEIRSQFLNGTAKGKVLSWERDATFRGFQLDFAYVPSKLGLALKPFLPGTLQGDAEQKLTATLEGRCREVKLWDLLRGSQAAFTVGLGTYAYDGFTASGMFDAKLENGRLAADGPLTVNGGTVELKTNLDVRDATARPQSTFEFDMTKVRVNRDISYLGKLNPIFFGASKVDGVASARLRGLWTGPLDTATAAEALQLKGNLLVEDLILEGSPMMGFILVELFDEARNFVAGQARVEEFTVDRGVISYEDFEVKLNRHYSISFKGRVTLDGKLDMIMTVPLTPHMLKRWSQLAPLGLASIKVPVRGTAEQPEIDWAGAVAETVKNAVKSVIEDPLKKIQDPKKTLEDLQNIFKKKKKNK